MITVNLKSLIIEYRELKDKLAQNQVSQEKFLEICKVKYSSITNTSK